MANVKDDSTVVKLPVNCLSQDGALRGELKVSINLPKSFESVEIIESETVVSQNKNDIVDDKIKHEEHCLGQEVVSGVVESTVGLPARLRSRIMEYRGTKHAEMGM